MNTTNKPAELETLASSIIGDGKLPNVYFVTVAGKVRYIATNFDEARELWRKLPRNIETALEDRLFGVIASTEPRDDEDTRLVTYDDSNTFAKHHPKEANA
jgi:hypothetical protein